MANPYDVIVVGAGNAALSAAIAAKEILPVCAWLSRRPLNISGAATPTLPAASSASLLLASRTSSR